MKHCLARMAGVAWAGILTGCISHGEPTDTLPGPVPCDWAGARWISDGRPLPATDAAFYQDNPAPQFRRTFFAAGRIRFARLHIAGLGLYEAHLNGRPLADGMLLPLWTPFGKRVLYDTHDVTALLRSGTNALAVTLGNGWYNPLPLRLWGRVNLREAMAVGPPCLIAKLEILFADGTTQTVASDAAWKTTGGPILRNSLYLGEVVDARLETAGWREAAFDDSAWPPAVRITGPAGSLEPRVAPPVAVRETWTAPSTA